MARTSWRSFLDRNPDYFEATLFWHSRQARGMVGIVPSPFRMLAMALDASLKNDWTMQSLGVRFRVLVVAEEDIRRLGLLLGQGEAPNSEARLLYQYDLETYRNLFVQFSTPAAVTAAPGAEHLDREATGGTDAF